MCSTQRDEVGAVKSELFKVGIRSEIRTNPVAAALSITRLELWVEHDQDYLAAQKLYARMQARAGKGDAPAITEDPAETLLDVEDGPAPSTRVVSRAEADSEGKSTVHRPNGELEQARLLLEQEIEEVLEREDALSESCRALQGEVKSLSQSLSDSQALSETKAAEQATLRSSLEQKLAERTRSEDQLKGEVGELQSRLSSAEETLLESQKRLGKALEQLQTQQAKVVELRKELESREQEFDDNTRVVSNAQAELAAERQSRITAEENSAKLSRAFEHLENQLTEQKELQEQMRASIGSLNSLRGKLQAKKTSVRAK